MNRWLALLLVGLTTPLVFAQAPRVLMPPTFKLEPFGRRQFSAPITPGQETRAIASGNGQSPLGLYIYDQNGNCMAFDDDIVGNLIDDRIVSFYPRGVGPVEIEIRNLGNLFNGVEFSAK